MYIVLNLQHKNNGSKDANQNRAVGMTSELSGSTIALQLAFPQQVGLQSVMTVPFFFTKLHISAVFEQLEDW